MFYKPKNQHIHRHRGSVEPVREGGRRNPQPSTPGRGAITQDINANRVVVWKNHLVLLNANSCIKLNGESKDNLFTPAQLIKNDDVTSLLNFNAITLHNTWQWTTRSVYKNALPGVDVFKYHTVLDQKKTPISGTERRQKSCPDPRDSWQSCNARKRHLQQLSAFPNRRKASGPWCAKNKDEWRMNR